MRIYDVAIRLALAVIVGGLIGYEREMKNRPAGFRTHILVCVGAAVTSMIQLYSIQDTINMILLNPSLESALKADIGRLGAQVITGVGFLGAGTILRDKGAVKGLTTAASIWTVACIGLAVGLGYYYLTILSTVCVFIVLVILKKFETRFIDKTKEIKLRIQHIDTSDSVHKIVQYLKAKEIMVKKIDFSLDEDSLEEKNTTVYLLVMPKSIKKEALIEDLSHNENIIGVSAI